MIMHLALSVFFTAVSCSSAERIMIDFDNYNKGQKLTNLGNGVQLSALRNSNSRNNPTYVPGEAMVFDSSNPSGGDVDLGTPNQDFFINGSSGAKGPGIGNEGKRGSAVQNDKPLGNVLIISEDGDSNDPDDNGNGGILTFDFAEPMIVHNIGLLDNEEGTIFELWTADGEYHKRVKGQGGDNSAEVASFADDGLPGVVKLKIVMYGSGAIPFVEIEKEADVFVCALPADSDKYSVITEGDARIGAHSMYKGLAVGGTLYDNTPNENGTIDRTQSRVKNVDNNASFNFNGGLHQGSSVPDSMFQHFKYLATHAESGSSGSKKVVVVTNGGTFNMYDFVPGGQGEDNGNTLVIFNTAEDVTLTKTHDGRQFGPSVIAPFSKVVVHGDSGFVDGLIVAKTFETANGNQGSLQLHGDVYTGNLICGQTPTTGIPKAGFVCSSMIKEADFTQGGPQGFSYADNMFRGTNKGFYAKGWSNDNGLNVRLGGVDSGKVYDGMSGGWSYQFTLDAPGDVDIEFEYTMDMNSQYENNEYVQVLLSVDNAHIGVDDKDYIKQLNGGGQVSSTTVSVMAKDLGVGTHTVKIGGYGNQKTYWDEETNIRIKRMSLCSDAAQPTPSPTRAPISSSPTKNPTSSPTKAPVQAASDGCASMIEQVDFTTGKQGFSYHDDMFRWTNNPRYSAGWHSNALVVRVGGVDNTRVYNGMSGGWSKDFTLPVAGIVTIEFEYYIDMQDPYENNEYIHLMAMVDSMTLGVGGNDYIKMISGGGKVQYTTVTLNTQYLSAGQHTIKIGGYNNQKTYSNEQTFFKFKNLSICSDAAAPTDSPTRAPISDSPTKSPTDSPTEAPSAAPVTNHPTPDPTGSPTESPSKAPVTLSPTLTPTRSPTQEPSLPPVTGEPSAAPQPGVSPTPKIGTLPPPSPIPVGCHGKCMEDNWKAAGKNGPLTCTAKEVTLIDIHASERAVCKKGERITVNLAATIKFNSGRYDPGWYIATDGGDAMTGECYTRPLLQNVDSTAIFDSPESEVFVGEVSWNADHKGENDMCGDVQMLNGGGGVLKQANIAQDIEITCADKNDDDNVDFAICFSWRVPGKDSTCDQCNLYPGAPSKCTCTRYDIPEITVEPPPITTECL